jgi:phospholipase C
MDQRNRRDFLRSATAGSAMAMLSGGLVQRALAIAPAGPTGSIMDVEHIVVLMQENRSFDHYFGMLNGVRGFGDPRPLRLPGGRAVWSQPSTQHADGYVMPFHGDSRTTRSFLVDGAEQSHVENMHIFNRGRYDRWGNSGELHNRMLYYTAGDLPFYYALANAFTVCDAYHASTMTQTYPNRLHLFTGCNGGGTVGGDPQMHNYGEDETPSADMATDRPIDPKAYTWSTYAERLQAAGIKWKVYQEYDNFGDNLLSVFPTFRPCAKDSELYRRGRSWVSEHAEGADRTRSDGEQLVAAFRRDIETGQLPQISWIVTAAALSEHPKAEPSRGEHVTAKLIEALIDNPQVFAKTAFILNFDEAGGFYDHMAPPVPPVGAYRGRSTVALDGEAKDYRGSGKAGDEQHPIGLGIRTPTVIISPWTRGGHVCSELFDHTSVLQFMEKRFGVREPNISAWRRSVCGDLTSAFDFADRGSIAADALPATDDFQRRIAQSTAGTTNDIPKHQVPTIQMSGQRAHRPLPYRISADSRVGADGSLVIQMVNHGAAGVVLTVHDNQDREEPRHFTIGAGDRIEDIWPADGEAFDLTLYGPNGFLRHFAGRFADGPPHTVGMIDRPDLDAAELRLENRGRVPLTFLIELDGSYRPQSARSRTITVPPGKTVSDLWRLSKSDNWYDLSITAGAHQGTRWRYAGKVENGRAGRTDPAIGAMRV